MSTDLSGGVRTLLHGGRVFDGSGSDPSAADIVLAGGRIVDVDVGTGLDGDGAVDVRARRGRRRHARSARNDPGRPPTTCVWATTPWRCRDLVPDR